MRSLALPFLAFLTFLSPIHADDRMYALTQKGTSINQRPVNANNGEFWIGKPTLSKPCPAGTAADKCPDRNVTAITLSPDRMSNVGYTQKIYIGPSGALRFTHPSTDPLVPANAFSNDLYWKTAASGAQLLTWAPYDGSLPNNETFYACPRKGKTVAPYKITVPEPGVVLRKECKAIWIMLDYYGDYGAWEYK